MLANKKAFTLFELIIVVVLIGIVYAVVLSSFKNEQTLTPRSFANLKQKLSPFWKKGYHVELYIYDRCSKSIVFINDIPIEKELNIDTTIFKDIKVYKTDKFADERKIKFSPINIDNRVYSSCFKFSIFPNGSSSSYIVNLEEEYYLFFPYMIDTKIVNTLNEATDIFSGAAIKKIVSYEQ